MVAIGSGHVQLAQVTVRIGEGRDRDRRWQRRARRERDCRTSWRHGRKVTVCRSY